VIMLPPDRKINFHAVARPACLLLEVVGEVFGILEEVTVNINKHWTPQILNE